MSTEDVGTRLAALIRSGPDQPPVDAVSASPDEPAGDPGTVAPDQPAGGIVTSVSGGGAHARATVDVPSDRWAGAVRAARDDDELDCDFFDWLTAVDELADGFTVVAHLWSTRRRHGVLLRTRIPRHAPVVPSIVEIFPGAGWHERETYEMFGIEFGGHPDLAPLLLPPEFEGHPLRKDFILASRVAKPWPGAKEPGESEHTGGRRQPMRPPGVPDPAEWGPQAERPAPGERAAPAGQAPAGQASAGQASAGQASAGQASAGQAPAGRAVSGERAAATEAGGDSPGGPPAGED